MNGGAAEFPLDSRTGSPPVHPLDRASWIVAYAAAVVFLGVVAWFGRAAWRYLPHASAAVLCLTYLGRIAVPTIAGRAMLLATYLVPTLFVLGSLPPYWSLNAIWLAALLGWIGAAQRPYWAVTPNMRFPLALWAMSLAIATPIVLLREVDFALVGLNDPAATSLGLATPIVLQWIGLTAATTLVGILWFDSLFAASLKPRHELARHVIVPLVASWVIAGCVGIYQAQVDLSFLSVGFWTAHGRATGTLRDANAFGAVCALWGPAFAAWLAFRPARRQRAAALGALAFGWAGVWASASRGAFVVCAVGSVALIVSVLRTVPVRAVRRRWLAGAMVLALVAGWALRHSGPLQRLEHLLDILQRSPRMALQVLWERDGHGTVSVAMIKDHPWVGIGIGNFHHTVREYAVVSHGLRLPPDNAQNWYRHQIAELGLLGSLGAMAWTTVFAVLLFRRLLARHPPDAEDTVGWLLVAFGAISLISMPGQDAAVALTFWTLAFWFVSAVGRHAVTTHPGRRHGLAWGATWAIALAFGGFTLLAARGPLRAPFRAARVNMPYTYDIAFGPEGRLWTTATRGVTVPRAESDTLRLTYWVEHPDAGQKAVPVTIWRDGEQVVDRRVFRNMRYTEDVPVTKGKRFVFEAAVDRTYTAAQDGDPHAPVTRGLSMQWEYLDKPGAGK